MIMIQVNYSGALKSRIGRLSYVDEDLLHTIWHKLKNNVNDEIEEMFRIIVENLW